MTLALYPYIVGEEVYEPLIYGHTSLSEEVLILDYYCVNPECSCGTIVLSFQAYGEESRELFQLTVTKDWKLKDLEIKDDSYDIDSMVHDFFEESIIRDAIYEHWKTVQKKLKKNPFAYMDLSSFRADTVDSYRAIFGTAQDQTFLFTYNGREYFVDDHYCKEVSCNCRNAILIFSKAKSQLALFSIYAGLKNFEYSINTKIFFMRKKKLHAMANHFLRRLKKNGPDLLGSRYRAMKRVGGYLKKNEREKDRFEIGRNTICPCGSGKKYKKCCGA